MSPARAAVEENISSAMESSMRLAITRCNWVMCNHVAVERPHVKKCRVRFVTTLILLFLCGQTAAAGAVDTGLVVRPSSFEFTGLVGTVFNDSLTIINKTGTALSISIAETSLSNLSRFGSSGQMSVQSEFGRYFEGIIAKLKPQLSEIKTTSLFHNTPQSESQLAYTTIITDQRGDTTLGSIDVYRVLYQRRVIPFVGTFHDFRFVMKLLPDSNVVGFLSLDTDQDFGTGSFPTPWGVGLTSRDIGSEYEILIDASGVIAESLGLGNVRVGVVFRTSDTTVVGLPLPLTFSRDSVFTITLANVAAVWLNDPGHNMNVGGVFARLGSGVNFFPDFAPDVGHGIVGTEVGVSWIREEPTSFILPNADSIVVRIKALAAKPAGTYLMNLQIKPVSRPTVNVPVTLTTLQPSSPRIAISPRSFCDTLVLGDSIQHTLQIANTGEGLLGYAVVDTANNFWLDLLFPYGFVQSNDTAEYAFRIRTTGLLTDTSYIAHLIVNSNDPDSGTIPVPIFLFVKAPPQPSIVISPSSISDTIQLGDSGTYTLTIQNVGSAELIFSIIDSAASAWLSFSPNSANLPPGKQVAVLVKVYTNFLFAGNTYIATLTISSNDPMRPTETVTIEISVQNILKINVEEGWNLLSTPLLLQNYEKSAVYPTSVSSAFIYQNGYQQVDSVTPLIGYWLKFSQHHVVSFDGNPLTSDTIIVQKRWNIIGALSDSIDVNFIQTEPPHLLASPFFSFSRNRGYEQAAILVPGKGYWIKANMDGKIIVPTLRKEQ